LLTRGWSARCHEQEIRSTIQFKHSIHWARVSSKCMASLAPWLTSSGRNTWINLTKIGKHTSKRSPPNTYSHCHPFLFQFRNTGVRRLVIVSIGVMYEVAYAWKDRIPIISREYLRVTT
jgi:hypothetical protein